MDGQVNILYNNQDAFFPMPTPYVGLAYEDVFYGGFWARLETITMNGQITGCSYSGLISGAQTLLNNFNQSFQNLQIFETDGGVSGLVFAKNAVEIDSISFGQAQSWAGVLPYTVTLKSYPSGYFSGQYGVIDPIDNWGFQISEDYVMNVVHTISCRGINTASGFSNALDNAKNWALSKTGFNYEILPVFIETGNISNLCLLTEQEQVDRINGTYAIIQNYINDTTRTDYGVLRFGVTYESGNDAISAKVAGSVQGCGQDIVDARSVFSGFDIYSAVSINYNSIFNLNDLNPIPLQYEVSEDAYNTKIEFKYEYDNNNLPPVYLDYLATLSSGTFIGAAIEGKVVARGGDILSKLQRSIAFAATTNLYNYLVPLYNQFYPMSTGFPLNPVPVTSGYVINQNLGQVTLTAEFNNFQQFPSGLDSFNYSMEIVPALEKLNVEAILNGNTQPDNYSIVDLGYKNRASINIKGNSRISDAFDQTTGLSLIKSKISSLFFQYGQLSNAIIDRETFSFNREDNRFLEFDVAYSFDSNNNVITTGVYGFVSNLNV
jgi:hypothetical protein